MQPRDEMVRTAQVSLEANSCDEQQLYRIRHSTMFPKQSKQAMSSSFSTFSNDFRNLSCLEAEEQAAPAAPSVLKTLAQQCIFPSVYVFLLGVQLMKFAVHNCSFSHLCHVSINMIQPHLYCQISPEAHSCDQQQVADVLLILQKMICSVISDPEIEKLVFPHTTQHHVFQAI